MAGMGPPPKAEGQRRRRNASIAMTQLPAGGRQGEPPSWPLRPDITLSTRRDMVQRSADELELALLEPNLKGRARTNAQKKADAAREQATILGKQLEAQAADEAELWAELWATPQAAVWERQAWFREVAQYVRWKVRAESGDLDSSKEARQLADRLGLTPLAMLRLRWEVSADEVGEQRQDRTTRSQRSARQRLKVVDDTTATGGA